MKNEKLLYTVKDESGLWWLLGDEFMPNKLLFVTNGDEDLLVKESDLTPVQASLLDLSVGDVVYILGDDEEYKFVKYNRDGSVLIERGGILAYYSQNVTIDSVYTK